MLSVLSGEEAATCTSAHKWPGQAEPLLVQSSNMH